jgi:hypothetical protein
MNMNGMMFGGEGPVMQGTWYNPTTGDAFTVRDSFFEDNQYVVTTTDGRYLKYNQIQNYIQTDMKLEDLKKRKAENQVKDEPLPAEVASLIEDIDPNDPYLGMMSPDDLMIGNAKPISFGNLADSRQLNDYVQTSYTTGPIMQTPSPATMNEAIIEKALKNAPKPEIKVDIFWDVYPEKQIEMLKDVMDISEDEIVNWYLDNIDMVEVVDALKVAIRDRILYKAPTITATLKGDLSPVGHVPTMKDVALESEAKTKKPRKTTKKQ